MSTEFRHDIDGYLAGLVEAPVRSLAEVVAFNEQHGPLDDAGDRRGTGDADRIRGIRELLAG